jgi:transglutaminase-like putative cysteine protease
MQIRVGFRLTLQCEAPTPLLLALSPHPDEEHRLAGPYNLRTAPNVPQKSFIDEFGNRRIRLVAPKGAIAIWSEGIAEDSGLPDEVDWSKGECKVHELPDETMRFLASSRYCETDLLLDEAWRLFGTAQPGWARVQAICDYVHETVTFGYQHARATKTALATLHERNGVCRDFAHLAIAFCRAMNIPARYVCGYLGDIGVPPAGLGDFCAWFEAYLDGRWYTFDARYNMPRIGRIVIARGRDAADVAMITSFGTNNLLSFEVWAEEILRPVAVRRARSWPLPHAEATPPTSIH